MRTSIEQAMLGMFRDGNLQGAVLCCDSFGVVPTHAGVSGPCTFEEQWAYHSKSLVPQSVSRCQKDLARTMRARYSQW